MENRNLNNSLFYGNIVKLESASKELLNDTLFFVDYIDDSKLKLISENMEMQIFRLNENGGIDNIDKIIIINQQEDGYCVINRLLPGKLIKINFSNEDAFIQGEIRKLENDMIVVKTQENELLYIDFEYSGLLEKYNIRSIEMMKSYQSYQTGEYDIIDNGRDTDDATLVEDGKRQTMYTIEQQVNDYIEKSKSTSKNKKKVISEIGKYKLLLEEYTALDSGIKIKQLPNNQILYSIFDLNPKVVNLFSSYLHKELFYNPEIVGNYEFDSIDTEVSKWQYSVIEKSYKDSTLEEFSDHNNITQINTKIKNYHKKIRIQTEQNIMLVNKVTRSNNIPFFFSIGNDGEIQVIPYDNVRAEKGNKLILNGLVFKNLPSIYKEMNIHHSSNLLSKSLQNLYVRYEKTPKAKILNSDVMKEKDYFDNKRATFYEFQEDKTFKEYIEDLDFGLKDIYEKLFDRKEVSMFQCVKKLALFNISKMNVSEHAFIQKLVRENISVTKKAINDQRAHFIRMNKIPDNYEYVPHENMYEIVKNSYLSDKKIKTNNIPYQMGELLKIASIDNMELLLFELMQLNRVNHIDFDDEDVDKYILDLQAQLNGEIPKDIDKNRVDYSKYYRTKNELLLDTKKIILKNINKNEQYDPIQYCYEYMKNNAKFYGDLNSFVKELDGFLQAMHEENPNFADFDNIFQNEADRDKIIDTLYQIITKTQIRRDDKCYVEDEKQFYIYDGIQWNNAKESSTSLDKKKFLQVKNSIDEFEDIKTKIVHESVIKYAQKSEQDTDNDHDFFRKKTQNKMIGKLKSLKENKLKQLLKYNSEKHEYEQSFDKLGYETLQHYSPHTNLLHIILGVDDLERKYSLIQRFISLYAIDNGDEKWFYCPSTNIKLIPKYLQKLSDAYLLYNNHDITMKEICHLEGHLSEEGDAWIHKESGFVIKKIDFDTNYGYDENGFKIKLDTIVGIDNIDDDIVDRNDQNLPNLEIKPSTSYKAELVKPQRKPNKQTMRLIKELTPIIMRDLDVKFRHNDDTSLIYAAMEEIFQESSQHPKFKRLSIIGNVYIITSMILIYVQCKNVVVGKSYSSCNISFSGFPYEQDESSLDGIKYLACYLNTRLDPEKQKNAGKKQLSDLIIKIFREFSSLKKTEEIITNDIYDYIKLFFLKNVFVKDMIQHKRNFESKNPKANFISPLPSMFKPVLLEISTQNADDEHGFKHKNDSLLDKHEKLKREMEMINLKIEEEVKTSIKKEEPLLKSHYNEPFIVNYCCQDKELTVKSLVKSEINKSQLSKLVNKSDQMFHELSEEEFRRFKGTTLLVPVLDKTEEEINVTRIYSQESLYSFLSGLLQFENKDKNIPEHLKLLAKEYNLEELDDTFYTDMEEIGKNGDIQKKIKLLEKYDIVINSSFMNKVLSQHHKYQYDKQKNRQEIEAEKLRLKKSNKTKVLSDFEFDYINNLETDKKQVGLRDNDFLIGNKEATATNNVDAVSRAIDVEENNKKTHDHENISNKFEKEREILSDNYNKFMSNHFNKSNHRSVKINMKTLLNSMKNGAYLEKKDNEQFELYMKQLYNINYQLIAFIPGLLFNNNFHNDSGFEQFNYAGAHIDDLKKHRQDYRNGFDKISNASEETIKILQTISNYKDVLYLKSFNEKRTNKYSFLLYLFYKLLNHYIELTESIDVVVNINFEIAKIVLEYIKNTSYSYEKMTINNNQSKQTEKSIKTEALRKMRPQEREAEKYKMSAKLGDWSYGNQSRVFKYYKQFYNEDTEKANEIKNIAKELYAETITDGNNEIYNGSQFENSLTDMINDEEVQNIRLVGDEDGIVLDEEGCEMNDYE